MNNKEASKLVKDFHNRFPKLKFWIDKMRASKIRVDLKDYKIQGLSTGRFQCKKPNQSNKPKGYNENSN